MPQGIVTAQEERKLIVLERHLASLAGLDLYDGAQSGTIACEMMPWQGAAATKDPSFVPRIRRHHGFIENGA